MRIPYVIDNQTHTLADVLNAILAEHASRSLDIASAHFYLSGYKELRENQEVHPEPQNRPKSGTMKCYRIDGIWLYCRLFTRRNSRWRNASPKSRLTELC